MPVTIDQIFVETPQYEEVAREYAELEASFARAKTAEQTAEVVHRWDQIRRRLETWGALVSLRFNQDTRNEEYKKEREYSDELQPRLTDLDVKIKRLLLASPHRGALEQKYGTQAFALWSADVMTFEPAIQDHLVREAKLQAEYGEVMATAKLQFRGETLNHSAIVKFREDPDRATRHEAEQVRWQWYADNRPQLDRIYTDMVNLRHEMARTLKFNNFVELGYQRMKRVDYNAADVALFRDEVRKYVVPLAVELRKKQAKDLGVDKLMFWDDAIHDAQGNPAPQGDHDWMVERAHEMFAAMGPELADFFRLMTTAKLTDLKNREGKSPGGFCTSFPSYGLPYIFANFNGTKHDVEVFTHEVGHAYQGYLSREQPLSDYLWPTYESCEIHSMGLEFLTWPHMEKFFGADAERFRRIHLTQGLLFLPYGVAVDHFQHLVYEKPEATAAERHGMWQEVERMYLPWRDYGDLPHVVDGGFWQFQRHIYLHPFYYIDYTLAQTCALQLWVRSRKDPQKTLDDYNALCRRGGEAPFQALARGAGLISPFEPGCLRDVVEQARVVLAEGKQG
ncbi:Peptidase family M3 [Anatilimnocola aggregata]|uniref:Peptidase family M3 n=1 Tax=Anatilimnocola aggregata TaxID=2528021 RepID=A0A517YLY5_9BACT|nr:M3 family oligoendopeptidase [Anatilimnocola aggregata]QDU31229.1 Peptidase family M3 [Anatilimnocola aggregata]